MQNFNHEKTLTEKSFLSTLPASGSGPLQSANTPDFYGPGCLLVLFTVGLLNIDCLPDLRGLINCQLVSSAARWDQAEDNFVYSEEDLVLDAILRFSRKYKSCKTPTHSWQETLENSPRKIKST